jgi:hypothetical protein
MAMNTGLLERSESIRIRLGGNKEILDAPDAVFLPENQEESRTMIYESHYLFDYLEEFSSLLSLGKPRIATVTEPGRQTSFRYSNEGADCILLTKEHRSIQRMIGEFDKSDV